MDFYQFAAVAALGLGLYLSWEHSKMADNLLRLRASIATQTSVIASAVALIGGLSQQIRDASDDPAALNALADQLDSQTAELSQAVAISTPASAEVHADDGGTGTDNSVVDPDTVEIAEPTEPTQSADSSGSGGEPAAEG